MKTAPTSPRAVARTNHDEVCTATLPCLGSTLNKHRQHLACAAPTSPRPRQSAPIWAGCLWPFRPTVTLPPRFSRAPPPPHETGELGNHGPYVRAVAPITATFMEGTPSTACLLLPPHAKKQRGWGITITLPHCCTDHCRRLLWRARHQLRAFSFPPTQISGSTGWRARLNLRATSLSPARNQRWLRNHGLLPCHDFIPPCNVFLMSRPALLEQRLNNGHDPPAAPKSPPDLS